MGKRTTLLSGTFGSLDVDNPKKECDPRWGSSLQLRQFPKRADGCRQPADSKQGASSSLKGDVGCTS